MSRLLAAARRRVGASRGWPSRRVSADLADRGLRGVTATCSTFERITAEFARNRRCAVRAAVLHAVGDTKLDIRDDVQVVGPGTGQVLIKMGAAGVCHSGLSARNGGRPQSEPAILGPRGAGGGAALR